MLDQFILEDELEPGCMAIVPIMDIPCGTVFPKPMPYAYPVFNLDPLYCDECFKAEEYKRFLKVYPGGSE